MRVERLPRTPVDQDLADARAALSFWHGRQERLAWHRRRDRAEARDHIARWHEHIVTAQLQRFGLERSHPLAPLVGWLGLPRREQARRASRLLMRTGPARWLRRVVVATAVATVAAFVLAAVIAGQLL